MPLDDIKPNFEIPRLTNEQAVRMREIDEELQMIIKTQEGDDRIRARAILYSFRVSRYETSPLHADGLISYYEDRLRTFWEGEG